MLATRATTPYSSPKFYTSRLLDGARMEARPHTTPSRSTHERQLVANRAPAGMSDRSTNTRQTSTHPAASKTNTKDAIKGRGVGFPKYPAQARARARVDCFVLVAAACFVLSVTFHLHPPPPKTRRAPTADLPAPDFSSDFSFRPQISPLTTITSTPMTMAISITCSSRPRSDQITSDQISWPWPSRGGC